MPGREARVRVPGRETADPWPRPTTGAAPYPGRVAGTPCRAPYKDSLAQARVAVRTLRRFCRKRVLEGGFWRPQQPWYATCRPVRGTCRKTPLQGAPTGWLWRARPRLDGGEPARRKMGQKCPGGGTKVSDQWDTAYLKKLPAPKQVPGAARSHGARGETRTHTGLPPGVFECG